MLVNGKEESLNKLEGVRTLQDFIQHLGLNPASIAVERNGEIPERGDWDRIFLEETDTIELIRFVGGG